MSFLTAILLFGQVATNEGYQAAANTVAEPAAVQVDASAAETAPQPPQADEPRRPATRATIVDTRPPASLPALQSAPVTPAAEPKFDPPPTTTTNSTTLQVAASMFEQMLALDAQSQQHVRRIQLVDALPRLGDPTQQLTAVRSYWDLARRIAHARYTSDKVRVLSEIAAPNVETDKALLEEALTAAEAEEAEAQDRLLAGQYELLKSTGLPADTILPWPADAPLVAQYRTQFETIFATRSAPLAVRQIHHSLPGKLLLIEKRVRAMAAAETATDSILEAYKDNRAPITHLLNSIERLEDARESFLSAVIDYNDHIAEYSLAVVGPAVGPETLVATLIRAPSANPSLVNIPGDVRQAIAAEPAPQRSIQR